MERTDAELIAAVLKGDPASFEPLVARYSPRIFATARRYARKESEVEDIAQEVWLRAYQKLDTYRREAPFEHWLMRLAVRVCYDFLRGHQRNRETAFSELSETAEEWLDRFAAHPAETDTRAEEAREIVNALLDRLSPPARLVITLLEIQEKSVREIAALTGWSETLVKVRAFRARAEMRKLLAALGKREKLAKTKSKV